MAIQHNSVHVFAPAKINLFLHVTGKRADGYHNLQSLVGFVRAGDELHFEHAPGLSLALDGPFAATLSGEADNLVLKAGRLLAERLGADTGAQIRLVKNLPVASGIGGGSADAAATLRGLLRLWGSAPRDFDALGLAAEIGSDVPVCFASVTAWMEGRGETVTASPALPPIAVLLVNPGIAISTADVFRRTKIDGPITIAGPEAPFASLAGLVDYLKATRNDLEPAALAIAPVVGDVLDALADKGAAFARMSGSGATCFGLFTSTAGAEKAADAIAAKHGSWWVCATEFAPADIARPSDQ